MTFYEIIGRIISPPVLFFLRLWTRFRGIIRVRVLLRNSHGEILLVKNWIGKDQWEMPGGGVNKDEDVHDAARRELQEETGISLEREDLHEIATYLGRYETRVFEAVAASEQLATTKRRKREITRLGWYAPTDLPAPLAWNVAKTLSKLPK